MPRVVLVILSYWAALLALSLLTLGLPISNKLVLTCAIAAGLPLLVLGGRAIWRAARHGASELAYRDDLTGVGNRRAFTAHARELLRESKLGAVALVIVQLNGLKATNDDCGHEAGDDLLVTLAGHISPTPASVYRIGGNEFAVLVDRPSGQSVTAVLRLLEPFRAHLAGCGHEHPVSVTYGYASNRDSESLDPLFKRADARMRLFRRQQYLAGALPDRRDESEPAERPALALHQVPSLEMRRKARRERGLGLLG